jgi:hypothetical protein
MENPKSPPPTKKLTNFETAVITPKQSKKAKKAQQHQTLPYPTLNPKKPGSMYPIRSLSPLTNIPLPFTTQDYANSATRYYEYNFTGTALIKMDTFELKKIVHKKTEKQKLAKIYNKDILEERHIEDIKREILVHVNLKWSESVLRLEEWFETQTRIYFVYEDGEVVHKSEQNCFENFFQGSIQSSLQMMKMFVDLAVGLAEVNSFTLALTSFGLANVVRTVNSDNNGNKIFCWKIFNFWNLSHYKKKSKKDVKVMGLEVDPEFKKSLKANAKTDTFSLGIFEYSKAFPEE